MQFAPPKKIHISTVTDSSASRPLPTPARVHAKSGDKNAVQGESVRVPNVTQSATPKAKVTPKLKVKAKAKAVVKARSKAKANPIPRTAGVSLTMHNKLCDVLSMVALILPH